MNQNDNATYMFQISRIGFLIGATISTLAEIFFSCYISFITPCILLFSLDNEQMTRFLNNILFIGGMGLMTVRPYVSLLK